jgi:hypothetical protein
MVVRNVWLHNTEKLDTEQDWIGAVCWRGKLGMSVPAHRLADNVILPGGYNNVSATYRPLANGATG